MLLVGCSLVIPFLLQMALVAAIRRMRMDGSQLVTNAHIFALIFSASSGFAFVSRVLDRRQAILVGLLYFPAMIALLLYFSLVFVARAFGDSV